MDAEAVVRMTNLTDHSGVCKMEDRLLYCEQNPWTLHSYRTMLTGFDCRLEARHGTEWSSLQDACSRSATILNYDNGSGHLNVLNAWSEHPNPNPNENDATTRFVTSTRFCC